MGIPPDLVARNLKASDMRNMEDSSSFTDNDSGAVEVGLDAPDEEQVEQLPDRVFETKLAYDFQDFQKAIYGRVILWLATIIKTIKN